MQTELYIKVLCATAVKLAESKSARLTMYFFGSEDLEWRVDHEATSAEETLLQRVRASMQASSV